jgi:hypothetical protein
MGLGGDSSAAAKALDEEQMSRIAQKIVDLVLVDVTSKHGSQDRVSMHFSVSKIEPN